MALRLGISFALADYQLLHITRCASDRCSATEAAQKKSSKPRDTLPPPPPPPGWLFHFTAEPVEA